TDQGSSWRVPRSVVVSWTRDQVSAYLACFPPTVHKTASPSLPRVPRVVPPAQRYYETLRLLATRLAALRFLSLTIARAVFRFFSGIQAASFDNTISDRLDTIQRA